MVAEGRRRGIGEREVEDPVGGRCKRDCFAAYASREDPGQRQKRIGKLARSNGANDTR